MVLPQEALAAGSPPSGTGAHKRALISGTVVAGTQPRVAEGRAWGQVLNRESRARPNIGLQLTAHSVRSSVAPTFGSS
jgi:hypothetical protein